MSKILHVTDYLWDPAKFPAASICVFFGDETYLKHLAYQHLRDSVLTKEDADFSLSRFEGATVPFPKVHEEVSTVAMFGGGKRLVVIEDADPFISKNRERLEEYAEKPSQSSVLLLLPASFPATTKLYKKLVASGLVVDCSPLPEKNLPGWILRWGKQRHQVVFDHDAAEMLVALVGSELGILDQEIGKLALMVSKEEKIDAKLVENVVGSWRTRTTFEMLDLALAGKTADAIRQLNNLIHSGESPVGILAQIAYTLRKLAAATRLILDAEKNGKRIGVAAALEQVGVKKFVIAKTETQLKLLGRVRGRQLADWLVQIDLDLKGASRMDPRLILERFLVRISEPRLKN